MRETLQRLDAQGAVIRQKRTTLFPAERELPDKLWSVLVQSLPAAVAGNFGRLIISEKYESAWRQAQRRFEELLDTRLLAIETGVARSNKKLDVLISGEALTNEKLEALLKLTVRRAEQNQRVDRAEAKLLQAQNEVEQWKRKYLELMKDQPSLEALLGTGDLDAAAEAKQAEIDRQTLEQAKHYFELGKIQELRFDWTAALQAYRTAWELGNDYEYGWRYGLLAAQQKHFGDAERVFEQLCERPATAMQKPATLIQLGEIYARTQRPRQAEDQFLQAGDLYRESASADSEEANFGIAAVQHTLGDLYYRLHWMPEAEKAIRLALKTYTELADRDPEKHLRNVAGMRENLANLLCYMERWDEAETQYLASRETFRELVKTRPAENTQHLANMLNDLALFYRARDRTEEEERALRESLMLFEKLAQTNPDAYEEAVAMCQDNLAILLSMSRRPDEAVAAYQEALDIRQRLARAEPAVYTPVLAMTLNDIGAHYQRYNMLEDALKLCQAAEQIVRPLWEQNPELHGDTAARVYGLKADLWLQSGRSGEEACQFYRTALIMAHAADLRRTIQELITQRCSGTARTALADPSNVMS